MKRLAMTAAIVLTAAALIAGGCGKKSSSLTPEERNLVWQRIKALEPVAAVHKSDDNKLVDATDAVFNEFKRATGHQIRTVERRALQDILDQQALQELDVFDAAPSAARQKALSRAKAILVHSCSKENENRFTSEIEQKWVITGSVRVVDLATGDTVYNGPTIKAGGKKTLEESIQRYAEEMGDRLRDDLGE